DEVERLAPAAGAMKTVRLAVAGGVPTPPLKPARPGPAPGPGAGGVETPPGPGLADVGAPAPPPPPGSPDPLVGPGRQAAVGAQPPGGGRGPVFRDRPRPRPGGAAQARRAEGGVRERGGVTATAGLRGLPFEAALFGVDLTA